MSFESILNGFFWIFFPFLSDALVPIFSSLPASDGLPSATVTSEGLFWGMQDRSSPEQPSTAKEQVPGRPGLGPSHLQPQEHRVPAVLSHQVFGWAITQQVLIETLGTKVGAAMD